MVLVLKTFAKREMCWRCTICKTPENAWPWVKTSHPLPQKEAWHWSNQTMMVTKTFGRFG